MGLDRRSFLAATSSAMSASALALPALAQTRTVIRVGYLHTLAVDGQLWLSLHLGAWARNGLEPRFIEFKTGLELFDAMAAGSLDS